jgi:hypothetical protein
MPRFIAGLFTRMVKRIQPTLSFYRASTRLQKPFPSLSLAERVGFDALIAEPCTALRGLFQARETKHLSELPLPPDLIDVF